METSKEHCIGCFVSKKELTSLQLWLEEDGFFRLRFEQKEHEAVTLNDEKGSYRIEDKNLVLFPVQREWRWHDSHDGDSGVDSVDLRYRCTFKNDNEVEVIYLEVPYLAQKIS